MEIREADCSIDYFLLSMAHSRPGNTGSARDCYDLAVQLIDQNQINNKSTMSEGNSSGGITEEIYATNTSGIEPSGPVSVKTGRSFIPARSPNGKFARHTSSRWINGFTVCKRVDIVALILEISGPLSADARHPRGSCIVLFCVCRDVNGHWSGLNGGGYQRRKSTLVIDITLNCNRVHFGPSRNGVEKVPVAGSILRYSPNRANNAPAGVPRYALYGRTDEVGRPAVLTGYGITGHGSTGEDFDLELFPTLRAGLNRIEADDAMPGVSILVADFDSGLPENNSIELFGFESDLGFGAVVPEPSSAAMLTFGVSGMLFVATHHKSVAGR
jgi:hypothetical protein